MVLRVAAEIRLGCDEQRARHRGFNSARENSGPKSFLAVFRDDVGERWIGENDARLIEMFRRDNSTRIEQLETQTESPFPPSFQYLLSNYSFPAFEFGPMMFFANTGENTFWELGQRLFKDEHMSPHLLNAGFLQIGNPYFYNYDPVCFDNNSPRIEKRIVQLDHEAILQRGEMKIIKEIAPSFVDLVDAALR